MDWMILPLRRYADFSGRSRRREYWLFTLLLVLVVIAIVLAAVLVGAGSGTSSAVILALGMAALVGLIVPSIAVSVRRLHDIGLSGWFYLVSFVPFGSLFLFVTALMPGQTGPNRYGDDPKASPSDIFS